MSWFNKLSSNGKEVMLGDKPQGTYWIEVADRPSELHVVSSHRVSDAQGGLVEWVFDGWAVDQSLQSASDRRGIDAQQVSDCQLDATIMNLVNQTRAEWRTWAGTNFPSLTAPERTKLGDLFWVVSLGVRRVVRNA